jgi:hypothetical protein
MVHRAGSAWDVLFGSSRLPLRLAARVTAPPCSGACCGRSLRGYPTPPRRGLLRTAYPEHRRSSHACMLRLDALNHRRLRTHFARTSNGERGLCGCASQLGSGHHENRSARSAARSHELSGKEGEGVLAGDDPRATIGAPTPSKSARSPVPVQSLGPLTSESPEPKRILSPD